MNRTLHRGPAGTTVCDGLMVGVSSQYSDCSTVTLGSPASGLISGSGATGLGLLHEDTKQPDIEVNGNYVNHAATEDLLIFGYESKLYRDDDKAEWIETGRHLIPWMGDSSILIDRYDVRGLLDDLKPDSSPSTTISTNEPQIIDLGLDDRPASLVEVEQLCDEERYMAMNNEGEDELTFHEMEFKKLQNAVSGMGQEEGNNYSSVGFNYDGDSGAAGTPVQTVSANTSGGGITSSTSPKRRRSAHEVPFVPPTGLHIPPGMTMPTKMKVHAIIEKTAKFVANHGPQMEIIVKTKQANNKHFNFLYYNDPLNEYYKNLLQAIKDNLYKPSEETSSIQDDDDSSDSEGSEEEEDEEGSSGYLHPSLMKRSEESTKPLNVNLAFRPVTSSNSAYSMLVSKIKEVTGVPSAQEAAELPPPPPPGDPAAYAVYENSSVQVYGSTPYQSGVHYGSPVQQVSRSVTVVEKSKPNSEEQVIIEKMAHYVIKNGPAFEAVASNKGDPRFRFLDPFHPHHWYYLNCKKRFSVEANAVVATGNPVEYKSSEKILPSSEQSSTTSVSDVSETSTSSTGATATAGNLKNNHANALSRMATLPPELINKIEELRKKTQQNKLLRESQQQEALAEKKPVIKFSTSLAKVCLGGVSEKPSENPVSDDTSSSEQPQSSLVSYPVEETKSAENQSTQEESETTQTQTTSELPSSDVLLQPNPETAETHISEAGTTTPESNSRKEERRRKAALFLQRLKRSSIDKENVTTQVQTINSQSNTNEGETVSMLSNAVNAKNDDIIEESSESVYTKKANEEEVANNMQGTSFYNPETLSTDLNSNSPNTTSGHLDAEPEPHSSDGEVHDEDTFIEKEHHTRSHKSHRKRQRSRSRSHSRSCSQKGERSSSEDEINSDLMNYRRSRSPKHKSHKKKSKHSSRDDDTKRLRKSPKKKKKHKSSKSSSRKSKHHRSK